MWSVLPVSEGTPAVYNPSNFLPDTPSSLPVSEGTPAVYAPYYGFGGSNQAFRANSFQPLTPDTDGPNEFLYVPNSSGSVVDLTEEIEIIQEEIDVINGIIIDLPVISFGDVGVTPNTAGGTITDGVINLQPADGTNPGVVTAGTQTIGGAKTLTGNVVISGTTALNGAITSTAALADPGGTQRTLVINTGTGAVGSIVPVSPPSGVTTMANIGGVPNAAGASISGSTLTLQPANSSNGGVISATGQTFGGTKTFIDPLTAAGLVSTADIVATTTTTSPTYILPATNGISIGTIQQPAGTRMFHTTSSSAEESVYLGKAAGNLAATSNGNVGIGTSVLGAGTTGGGNTVIGHNTFRSHTTGTNNTVIGSSIAGLSSTISTGNVIIGAQACGSITSLSSSIVIGRLAGAGLGGQADLIEIGVNPIGPTPSGAISIGSISSTTCFIRGISGVTPASSDQMVIMSSANQQLGTTTYGTTVSNFTPTIDSGIITSSTVRGSPGTSIGVILSRVGRVVTMTIPGFLVTAQSMLAYTITFTGGTSMPALYRPGFQTDFVISARDGGFVYATMTVTPGGFITMATGAPLNLPFGITYDVSVTWQV